MTPMNVLLLGSGGREHALAACIARSPRLNRLTVAPGNPGTSALAVNVSCDITDPQAVVALARREAADLVVVGPEAPLVAGVADALADAGIAVFGPSRAAAMLEGSKAFTKALCEEFGIPTAAYARFTVAEEARRHLRTSAMPVVIKADGLAAGKGVRLFMVVLGTAAGFWLARSFGAAGSGLEGLGGMLGCLPVTSAAA